MRAAFNLIKYSQHFFLEIVISRLLIVPVTVSFTHEGSQHSCFSTTTHLFRRGSQFELYNIKLLLCIIVSIPSSDPPLLFPISHEDHGLQNANDVISTAWSVSSNLIHRAKDMVANIRDIKFVGTVLFSLDIHVHLCETKIYQMHMLHTIRDHSYQFLLTSYPIFAIFV